DFEPASRFDSDFNGAVQTFFGSYAAEEEKVIVRLIAVAMQIAGQAVIDRRLPVSLWKRPALVVGDRNQRHIRVSLEQQLQVVGAQHAVQRSHIRRSMVAQKWKMQIVAMK